MVPHIRSACAPWCPLQLLRRIVTVHLWWPSINASGSEEGDSQPAEIHGPRARFVAQISSCAAADNVQHFVVKHRSGKHKTVLHLLASHRAPRTLADQRSSFLLFHTTLLKHDGLTGGQLLSSDSAMRFQ